jgi:hypothetical protein
MIRHVIGYDNPCLKLDVSRDTETDTIVDEPDRPWLFNEIRHWCRLGMPKNAQGRFGE